MYDFFEAANDNPPGWEEEKEPRGLKKETLSLFLFL